MSRLSSLVLTLSVAGFPALAQSVTGDEAASLLFAPAPAAVEIDGQGVLAKDEAKMLAMVAQDQPYYAAIAISPDEGLMSEATIAAANHHTIEAASAAALGECNAKKKGAADCVIVAFVRPDGWEARPLQLSMAATQDFANYSGGALAISAATGAWGMGGSADEAVAACVAKQEAATDCTVAIAD
ncbi:MAG: 5-aminolevulic acid synthase [Rhodobacter sp.]|nr:5-aminolevulic acid synthase [Rhodobacter sp.]